MLTHIEGYMAEQERTVEHWKRCFSQLAALANGAIDGVPRMLAEAESACSSLIHQAKSRLL